MCPHTFTSCIELAHLMSKPSKINLFIAMLCKEDKMKALPIVIAYNMEFWCNNWYV